MSGGTFDYNQYKITDIADEIQSRLDRQGQTMDDRWHSSYDLPFTYMTFPPEAEQRLKDAVKALRIAAIYAQRADWYLAGDDGEESFVRRLDEELKELEKQINEQ